MDKLISIETDYDKIFDEAILTGILSGNENDKNFAGNFMYMYTKNGINYFKNTITRLYGYDLPSITKACGN